MASLIGGIRIEIEARVALREEHFRQREQQEQGLTWVCWALLRKSKEASVAGTCEQWREWQDK